MVDVEQMLVDIDTQRDFMLPGGALYVPGAEEIIPNLARLFDHARTARVPVLSSADCHAPDDPEFEQFPPHCIAGTDGQAKIPETLMSRYLVVKPDREIDATEQVFEA
jgi:nicotinamidase/pyrazinamidase